VRLGAAEFSSREAGSFLNMLTLTTAGSCSQLPRIPGGRLPVMTHQANAEITNGPVTKPARMTAPRRISTGMRGMRRSSRSAMTRAYPIKWLLSSRTSQIYALVAAGALAFRQVVQSGLNPGCSRAGVSDPQIVRGICDCPTM
jgi:hypothetical protein